MWVALYPRQHPELQAATGRVPKSPLCGKEGYGIPLNRQNKAIYLGALVTELLTQENMLYSWQSSFTLKQDDLWSWRPRTLPDFPTHLSLSLQVPEAGAVGFSLEKRDYPCPGYNRCPKSQTHFLPGVHWLWDHWKPLSIPGPCSLVASSQARLGLVFTSYFVWSFFFGYVYLMFGKKDLQSLNYSIS